MLDLRNIVENTVAVAQKLVDRGEAPTVLDKVVEADHRRRNLIASIDLARMERNSVSKNIGVQKRPPSEDEKQAMRRLGEKIEAEESSLRQVEDWLRTVMLTLPNLPLNDVATGVDQTANEVVEEFGAPRRAKPTAPHWEVAERLALYDLTVAAKISGARFYMLQGDGAKLNRVLANWMLDTHTTEFGYTEIEPPALVRAETMLASGNLPKFRDNLYHDDETNLWLIPTAEVALNAIWRDAIVPYGQLPMKYVASTNCFRKEHTAGGRDVRGVKRVHQFQKVELFRCETPEASEQAQMEILEQVKTLCERLELAGRVVKLGAGDMGFQAARTYDIEVWAPGSGEWLEVSSVSTCTDFQARRGNMRYRPHQNAKPEWLHTLNGSGLALPRIWAALLENGLRDDGAVDLPEVLIERFGGNLIKRPLT